MVDSGRGTVLAAFGAPLVYGIVHGDRSWLVGALGATVFVLLVFAQQIRSAHMRDSIKKLQRLNDGKILLSASDDGLTFESSTGSMLMRWNDLKEVRLNRDYWLLLRAPNDFSTLPLANIAEGLQADLLSRFRAAGVRVRSS